VGGDDFQKKSHAKPGPFQIDRIPEHNGGRETICRDSSH